VSLECSVLVSKPAEIQREIVSYSHTLFHLFVERLNHIIILEMAQFQNQCLRLHKSTTRYGMETTQHVQRKIIISI